MDITVFIPTRGRVGEMKQITLRDMKQFAKRYRPIIVCPPDEVPRHKYYHDLVVGCPFEGIGPTRQWILENSSTRGVVMLDDDMYFSYRPVPDIGGAGSLARISDMNLMFDWISDQLDAGFIHGGVSARQGNQNIERASTDCIRVNNAHFFDREIFLGESLKFDTLPVMEDFYITLSLLLRGYPNRVAYHYCWSQRGSGFQGGCSLYRTAEVQAEAAMLLYELFPDYIRVVEKESLSQQGVMASRKDVNISWLKAWEARDSSKRINKDHPIPPVDTTRR